MRRRVHDGHLLATDVLINACHSVIMRDGHTKEQKRILEKKIPKLVKTSHNTTMPKYRRG